MEFFQVLLLVAFSISFANGTRMLSISLDVGNNTDFFGTLHASSNVQSSEIHIKTSYWGNLNILWNRDKLGHIQENFKTGTSIHVRDKELVGEWKEIKINEILDYDSFHIKFRCDLIPLPIGQSSKETTLTDLPPTTILIVGGGPNGMFAAYSWLKLHPNVRVELVDERYPFVRPQVLTIPPEIQMGFEDDIKKGLWNDVQRKDTNFLNVNLDNKVNIGNFQNVLLEFIENKLPFGKERFHFDRDNTNHVRNYDLAWFEKVAPNYDIVIVATGNKELALKLRERYLMEDKLDVHPVGDDMTGIYLTYNATGSEDNQNLRDGHGSLLYFHSNDPVHNHAQIYTFPYAVGASGDVTLELIAAVKAMPETFKAKAQFTSDTHRWVNLADTQKGVELDSQEKAWLKRYEGAVRAVLNQRNIRTFPSSDLVNVFYADRVEYHYSKVAIKIQVNGKEVSLLFVGDSAGGSDYRLGRGLARGMHATRSLVDGIYRLKFGFVNLVDYYQAYWGELLKKSPDFARCLRLHQDVKGKAPAAVK